MAHSSTAMSTWSGPRYSSISAPASSVSKDTGKTVLSIVNHRTEEPAEVRIQVKAGESTLPSTAAAMVLTGDPADENTFEAPDNVKPRAAKVEGEQGDWRVVCEPSSLTVVTFTDRR